MSKICLDCRICKFCIVPPFNKGRVIIRRRDRQKPIRAYGTVPYGRNVRYRNRTVRYGAFLLLVRCGTVRYGTVTCGNNIRVDFEMLASSNPKK